MTTNTLKTSLRQAEIGSGLLAIKAISHSLTLSTLQSRSKLSRKSKTTLTTVYNIVISILFRNHLQEPLHRERK